MVGLVAHGVALTSGEPQELRRHGKVQFQFRNIGVEGEIRVQPLIDVAVVVFVKSDILNLLAVQDLRRTIGFGQRIAVSGSEISPVHRQTSLDDGQSLRFERIFHAFFQRLAAVGVDGVAKQFLPIFVGNRRQVGLRCQRCGINGRSVVFFIGVSLVFRLRTEAGSHVFAENRDRKAVSAHVDVAAQFPFFVAGRFQGCVSAVAHVGHQPNAPKIGIVVVIVHLHQIQIDLVGKKLLHRGIFRVKAVAA